MVPLGTRWTVPAFVLVATVLLIGSLGVPFAPGPAEVAAAGPIPVVSVSLYPENMDARVSFDKGATVMFGGNVSVDQPSWMNTEVTLSGRTESGWTVSINPNPIRVSNSGTFMFGFSASVPEGTEDGLVETVYVTASCKAPILAPIAASDSSTVTVENTSPEPSWSVRITEPSPGAVFETESLTISGTAAYNLGNVSAVEVKVCTGPWTVATGKSEWTIDYDCSSLADGLHTIYARARSGDETSPTTVMNVTQQRPAAAAATSPENDPGEPTDPGINYRWPVLVLIIAIVVTVVLYYVHNRRERADLEFYGAHSRNASATDVATPYGDSYPRSRGR